jgi:hypothetical protein
MATVWVKHSPGLGGWVVYEGHDFVGGTFSDRSDAERDAKGRRARAHSELLEALRADGHDVEEWADDPDLLRAYASAIDFNVKEQREVGQMTGSG